MEKGKLLYSNNYINIFINSKYIHWKSHNTKCTSEELNQLIDVSNTILDKLYNEGKMIGLIWDMRSTQILSPKHVSQITNFVSNRTEKNDSITIASLIIIESSIIRNLFNIGLKICPPKKRPVIVTDTFDKAVEIIEYHRNLLSET
tara:strand:- start:155 stop:592 length:438 start_codon:yes stop_codon:yes gene_type:complete